MQIQVINDMYTSKLSDLRPGEICIGRQGDVYACIYVPHPKETRTQIFKLDDMGGQYNDHIDHRMSVRVLKSDERVVLTI